MAYFLKCISGGVRMAFHRNYCATSPLVLSEEVRLAKAKDKPIVALESTIITHGMPYPQNLETALEVENIIRRQGAVPATVAILKGQLTVGLNDDQLRYLAQAKGVIKASRRDLAPVSAARLDGATTVAGTIVATELAEIPIFVTGGIGGVHRNGENTLDISADLNELGRSKTLVVCSGVKSILDIGRTLEYLETQGVCVCSFGDSDEFPAFYTVRSGHRAPHRVENAEHAARVLLKSRALKLTSGIVIAVPLPLKHAMDEKTIETAINCALEEAKTKNIHGKEITPFILSAVANATGGTSLNANIALIKNNAKVGADIAVEFKKLKNVNNLTNAFNIGSIESPGKNSFNSRRKFHTTCSRRTWDMGRKNEFQSPLFIVDEHANGDVLVIGGANVDRTYRIKESNVQLDGTTHPCTMQQCGGGVGRNIAEALWRLLNGRTKLLTAIGDDADGRYLANIAPGIILDGCVTDKGRTPTYAAVLDSKGECVLGLGDMDLHNHITIDLVNKHIDILKKAPIVVLDGNVPQNTIDYVLQICEQLKKPVFYEPTDLRKAVKCLKSKYAVAFSSPNLTELRAMAYFIEPTAQIEDTSNLKEILNLSKIVSAHISFLIVTIGCKGVITVNNLNKTFQKENDLQTHFYPVQMVNNVENVSGAGDCFASGFIYGILSNCNESKCVFIGFDVARAALLSKNTVPVDLNIANFNSKYPNSFQL